MSTHRHHPNRARQSSYSGYHYYSYPWAAYGSRDSYGQLYASASGSGSGSGYGHKDCCPLVVDALTLLTLLAGIAAATAFLYILITMNITGRKRRELTMKIVFTDLLNAGECSAFLRGRVGM